MNQLRKEKKNEHQSTKIQPDGICRTSAGYGLEQQMRLMRCNRNRQELHCRKICPGGSNRAGYTHSGPIPGKCKDLEYASSPGNNHDLPGAAIQQT